MTLAWVVAGLLWAVSESPPRVSLVVDSCPGIDVDEVRRIVAVELGALLGGASTERPEDTTRVHSACAGGTALVSVDDPMTGKSLARRVDLGSVPRVAASRLLAVAIAELVAASWIELTANPVPAIPRPDATASPAARRWAEGIVRRSPLWRMQLAITGSAAGVPTLPTFGAGLAARYLAGSHLASGGDVRVEYARRAFANGTAHVVMLSTGLVGWYRHDAGWAEVAVGTGGRVGSAWIAGEPQADSNLRGRTVSGPFLGPLFTAELARTLAPGVTIALAVEAGTVVLPVIGRAGDRRVVGVDGPWLGVAVAAGLELP